MEQKIGLLKSSKREVHSKKTRLKFFLRTSVPCATKRLFAGLFGELGLLEHIDWQFTWGGQHHHTSKINPPRTTSCDSSARMAAIWPIEGWGMGSTFRYGRQRSPPDAEAPGGRPQVQGGGVIWKNGSKNISLLVNNHFSE